MEAILVVAVAAMQARWVCSAVASVASAEVVVATTATVVAELVVVAPECGPGMLVVGSDLVVVDLQPAGGQAGADSRYAAGG